MSQYGVGIIGLGFGASVHAKAWLKDPRVRLIAISGRDQSRSNEIASKLGIHSLTVDELLSNNEIQILSLAVPPSAQEELIVRAAKAKKHLFCEKPFGASLAACRTCYQAVDNAKIIHGINLTFPAIDAWQETKSSLGKLGSLSHAHLSWRVSSRAFQNGERNWKTLAGEGGGTLVNFGAHTFYYLEWLFGPIKKVIANKQSDTDLEAHVEVLVTFEGGMTGSITLAADAIDGTGHRLEIYGSEGSLSLENNSGDFARGFTVNMSLKGSKKIALYADPDQTKEDGRILPTSKLMSQLIDTIESEGQSAFVPSLLEGLRVQELIDACERSLKQQQWINL